MRGKLERHFADYTEYSDLAVQCGAELSKLQDEKSSLQNRLNQIDANIIQVFGIKLDQSIEVCVCTGRNLSVTHLTLDYRA